MSIIATTTIDDTSDCPLGCLRNHEYAEFDGHDYIGHEVVFGDHVWLNTYTPLDGGPPVDVELTIDGVALVDGKIRPTTADGAKLVYELELALVTLRAETKRRVGAEV